MSAHPERRPWPLWLRILNAFGGVVSFFVGVVGAILPVMPGIPFFALSYVLLVPEFPWLAKPIVRALRRWPKLRRAIPRKYRRRPRARLVRP